jgi:hypothetical protein
MFILFTYFMFYISYMNASFVARANSLAKLHVYFLTICLDL